MIIEHQGVGPIVDPTAWVAPDATLCGDVRIGPGVRIMHGARLIGEAGGAISIGAGTIVLENAVVRATRKHDCLIGAACLIGPNTHVVGARIADRVFIATGAAVFHGASLGKGAEVRINAVVHIATAIAAGETVPIGWIAVGTPATMLSPDRHEEIWAIQRQLDFPGWVYDADRTGDDVMAQIVGRMGADLGSHRADRGVV